MVILQAFWGTPSFHSLWAENLLPRATLTFLNTSHRSLNKPSDPATVSHIWRLSRRSVHAFPPLPATGILFSLCHFWQSYLSWMFHLRLSLPHEFFKCPILQSYFSPLSGTLLRLTVDTAPCTVLKHFLGLLITISFIPSSRSGLSSFAVCLIYFHTLLVSFQLPTGTTTSFQMPS